MKLSAAKRILQPLSYRDFRLLWIGQAISAFGNPFQVVAVAWLVLQLKGSPLDLASAMLALSVPQIVVTFAGGVLVDRLDARTIMLWTDMLRVCTTSAIALLAFTGQLSLWLLCALLVVHSIANGLFNPAATSIPPRLVPREMLDGANAMMMLLSQLGVLFGAVPAGLIVVHGGPALAFAIDAASFVIAVLAALLMKPLSRELRSEQTSVFRDAFQGLTYLWSFPWLIALLLVDSCAAIAAIGPTTVGLPLLANGVLHAGAGGYSLLLWGLGCGSVIGMLLPAIYSPHHHRGRLFCLIQMLEAPLQVGIGFAPLPVAMFCLAGAGLLNGILIIFFLSLIQANVAKNMLGRMMSFCMLASVGFVPLSQYATGLIINFAGVQVLFLASGALTLVSAALGLLIPALRRLD